MKVNRIGLLTGCDHVWHSKVAMTDVLAARNVAENEEPTEKLFVKADSFGDYG